MLYKLTIPAVAKDVEEVRVLEWHGDAGTAFAVGELVLEFETHKALVEVRARQAAVLRRILAPVGEWSAIGGVVALFSSSEADLVPETLAEAAELAVDFQVD